MDIRSVDDRVSGNAANADQDTGVWMAMFLRP